MTRGCKPFTEVNIVEQSQDEVNQSYNFLLYKFLNIGFLKTLFLSTTFIQTEYLYIAWGSVPYRRI